jgi:hypothetical protein
MLSFTHKPIEFDLLKFGLDTLMIISLKLGPSIPKLA